MAARAVCESPPAIQQPVALNDDNNNVINTMMSAIGIGRDSTRPREAAIVHWRITAYQSRSSSNYCPATPNVPRAGMYFES